MKNYRFEQGWQLRKSPDGLRRALLVLIALVGLSALTLNAQSTNHDGVPERIQKLTEAMARTQAQLEQSQRELTEMRQQLSALQRQVAQSSHSSADSTAVASVSSSVDPQADSTSTASEIEDIRERQAVQESQIATHEQSKVESESKYPVKLTGLALLNGFVNTRAVDAAATPSLALPGNGSTGASLRQTILGFDARGPHLFGAQSYADLRVDFDASSQSLSAQIGTPGYYSTNATLLRLRTAHAMLQWPQATVYFALDRPILSPDMPSSLTAVAVPALAWSGNLWTWNPQVGATRDFAFGLRDVRLQAALIDVGDAPLTPVISTQTSTPSSTAERSRWPGVEARIALLGSRDNDQSSHLGFGGYFAPHHLFGATNFDAWAGTLDARVHLPFRLEWIGNFYRGQALGGLGGGAYKDFAYSFNPVTGEYDFQPLDDVGGWTQIKERVNERLEFNAAFGLDNVFTGELRPYAVAGGTMFQNLARNRTYTGNVIYSPSAYLLFSLEYRHLQSSPVNGNSSQSDIIGVGAGYKF
jgi:hypothetical protein